MFDWQRGQWRRAGAGEVEGRVTVASDWAPIRGYEALMREEPGAVYGDLLEVLGASDLNVVNVEAVLGEAGEAVPKCGPALRGPAEAVAALPAAGFEVACLANNHIMDFGEAGLVRTMEVLADAGLATVGAGLEEAAIRRPVVRAVRGTRVGIINCAEGESGRSVNGEPGVYGLDVAAVGQQIAAMRVGDEADVVVVIFHGGREHVPVPPPYVVRQMRQLAELGADAVAAHHPHVPQGLEIHRGVPIAYSLGNFVFWQGTDLAFRRLGYLLHLDVADGRLAGCAVTPYALGPGGLRRLAGAMRERFAERMARASEPLGNEADLRAVWEAFLDINGPAQLGMIPERLGKLVGEGPDVAAAAWLKNMFFTPAHSEMFCDTLERMVRGTLGQAPGWAKELLNQWLTERFEAFEADGCAAS